MQSQAPKETAVETSQKPTSGEDVEEVPNGERKNRSDPLTQLIHLNNKICESNRIHMRNLFYGLKLLRSCFHSKYLDTVQVARVLWVANGGPAQRSGIKVGDKVSPST